MLKSFLAVTALGLALAAPAYADDMMKCDHASMMKMDSMIKADTNPAMKKDTMMATKEMDIAKMAMKSHKMDECMMHMNMAKKDMMMK
jgi:hypothetical protein